MIKPVSGKCNAACKYCFYRDEVESRAIADYGFFTQELASIFIKKALTYVDGGHLTLVFQGGEPTLIGLDFYKYFFETLKTQNFKGATFTISMQTNGILIDERWCNLFKEYNVLVGLSLDGDKISNSERIDRSGRDIYARILDTARMLKEHRVEFNILSVIHAKNVKRGTIIYDDFSKRGFKNLQFIPYLGENPDYVLNAEDYAKFLIDTYSRYAHDFNSATPTRIRQFDNYIMLLQSGCAEQCGMNGRCEEQLIIEADGRAYPCDFYCIDEYEIGSIQDLTIEELLNSNISKTFRATSNHLEKCRTC
ncbi:MAG: radical SAM protein [Clostridia bacterium]|nr:radical SAM protein [Clostridia bacterium]